MAKVLIVEDDQTMLSLLITLLGYEGYETDDTQDFKNLLEVASETQPDIILMDVHLINIQGQEVNGLELLQKLQANPATSNIDVIMASGIDLKHKCLEYGAKDFLLKPFMPEELITKLKILAK